MRDDGKFLEPLNIVDQRLTTIYYIFSNIEIFLTVFTILSRMLSCVNIMKCSFEDFWNNMAVLNIVNDSPNLLSPQMAWAMIIFSSSVEIFFVEFNPGSELKFWFWYVLVIIWPSLYIISFLIKRNKYFVKNIISIIHKPSLKKFFFEQIILGWKKINKK